MLQIGQVVQAVARLLPQDFCRPVVLVPTLPVEVQDLLKPRDVISADCRRQAEAGMQRFAEFVTTAPELDDAE